MIMATAIADIGNFDMLGNFGPVVLIAALIFTVLYIKFIRIGKQSEAEKTIGKWMLIICLPIFGISMMLMAANYRTRGVGEYYGYALTSMIGALVGFSLYFDVIPGRPWMVAVQMRAKEQGGGAPSTMEKTIVLVVFMILMMFMILMSMGLLPIG